MRVNRYVIIILTVIAVLLLTAEEKSTAADTVDKKETPIQEDTPPPSEAPKNGDDAQKKPTGTSESELKKYDSDQNFNIKLRNIEEKINSLKDRIFRAKQRLSILKETVLTGAVAGSRAEIIQHNTIGGAFELVSAIYYLDDTPVYKKINTPDALEEEEIVIFDDSVLPGPHHLSVYLEYRGSGYGVFSYMEGYKFKIRAGHSFNIEEGRVILLKTIPQDRGVFYDIEERLNIEFDVTQRAYEKTNKDGME